VVDYTLVYYSFDCVILKEALMAHFCGCYLEMYRKIDTPMHPEFHPEKLKELQLQKEESKSTFRKIFSNIKSKFSEWKNYVFGENESPIPCVHIYLAEYYELLTGKVYSDIDPYTVLNNIVVIYQSLHRCYFHYDNNSRMVCIKSVKEVSECY